MFAHPRLLLMACALVACLSGDIRTFAQPGDGSSPTGALRLRTDRPAADRLRSAQQALREENFGEAARWIERLRSDDLIPAENGAISGVRAARQLTQGLSVPQAALVRSVLSRQAEQEWAAWKAAPNLTGLQEFCHRFGDTSFGRDSWMKLAIWLRDDGNWRLAAAAWRQVLQHSAASTDLRQRAQAAIVEAETQLQRVATIGTPEATEHGNDSARPSRLAAAPQWTHAERFPQALQAPWENWLREMRLNGAIPWTAAEPHVVGDSVYLRTPTGLTAYHLQTGAELWRSAAADWGWIERTPGHLENFTFQMSFLDQFGRQLVADTVRGRMTSDSARLFLVHDPGSLLELATLPGTLPVSAARELTNEPHNYLVAHDRRTGQLVWKLGGNAAGPTYPLADQYFCGPPLVIDDLLFVIGQQHSELQLLAIDAERGELLWKLVLGDVPRSLAADPARQRIACTPVWHDGQLLCPTGAGALIAVNPLTRSIEWAQRYGMTVRDAAARPRGESTAFLPDVWWDGWKHAEIIATGTRVCVVSPESDYLHQFDSANGKTLWSIPRDRGLCLLGDVPQGIVIQECDAVRLHDRETGALRWRTVTGEAMGQAALTERHVLIPTTAGSVNLVQLRDGVLVKDDFAGRELGRLQPCHDGWIVTTFSSIAFWPDSAAEVTRLAKLHAPLGDEPARQMTLAKAKLAAGELAQARELLTSAQTPEARELLRLAVLGELRQSPEKWSELLSLLASSNPAAASDVNVASVLQAARAGASQQDHAAALQLLLSTLNSDPRQGTVPYSNPPRYVRPDLAIIGCLADLLAVDGPQARVVNESLRQHWQSAVDSRDPFAIQKLAELWKPLPLADELLSTADRAPFLGQSLLAMELRLLKAAASDVEPAARGAQRTLSEILRESGFETEAREYTQLYSAAGSVTDEAPAPVAATPLDSVWTGRRPTIERTMERNDHVYYFPVPFDHDASPFFDRLDMTIERQGKRVRFGGGGHAGTWEVPLPGSNSSYRYLHQHVAAWGRGRVIVLRVGFELFGLAPVDERGEPAAHVLWHLDTRGGSILPPERLRLEITPAVPGIREDEYRVLDPFGHIVAQVGPVRPEFLCYCDKGQLICIDLLTGIRRWSRWDVPPGTLLGGDDEVILLWQPEARRLDWIRAIDGQTLGQRACDVRPEEMLRQSGRLAWVLRGGRDSALTCIDLVSGDERWRRVLPAGTVACVLDPAHLGVIAPGGSLQIVRANSGEDVATAVLSDVPSVVDRVVVARDARQWYVAVSERVPQQAGLQQAQLRSGYRAPFLTGPLAAISRANGQTVWQTSLVREPFPCDQPKSSPVLLQIFKQPPPDLQSGQITDGVVKLIDKASGDLVMQHRGPELIGYAAMSTDAPNSVVHLALERETVRLWYRPRPPVPAMPNWD